MGLFTKIINAKKEKQKLEQQRLEEERLRLQAAWKEEAKVYFDRIMNKFEAKDVLRELIPNEIKAEYTSYNSDDGEFHYFGLDERQKTIINEIYRLYFGEYASSIDDFFADDMLGFFDYRPLNPRNNPLDLKLNPGPRWALEFAKANSNTKVSGIYVNKAVNAFIQMEGERQKRTLFGGPLFGSETLNGSDFYGTSRARRLIFTPGFFNLSSQAILRKVIFYYKTLLDPVKMPEIIESVDMETLEREFSLSEKPTPAEFPALVDQIFFNWGKSVVEDPMRIIFTIESLFSYTFIPNEVLSLSVFRD